MARKFYTVLITKSAQPRFRKLHLSAPFAITVAIAGILVLGAGLLTPNLIYRLNNQSVSLDRLEHENHRLVGERDQFEGALAEVTERLNAAESQASRLAREMGVEGLPSEDAAGGPAVEGTTGPERFRFQSELRALETRTRSLDHSFDQLGNAFEERTRRLASTPDGMPVEGWFSHGYGWRKDPFSGKRAFHRGIDIVAPARTPILSPADGVISRVTRVSDYGKTLDISHGYGFVTRYAHMSETVVREGDRVKRGDVVGRVGSTGRSTGPHLHYEVFRDGRRVNPWKYLGK